MPRHSREHHQPSLREPLAKNCFKVRRLLRTCFPTQEKWDEWALLMTQRLDEDMASVNEQWPYQASEFFEAASLYWQGAPRGEIKRLFPQINSTTMVATTRDLCVLSDPGNASQFGYDPDACNIRSRRMLGLEPRTPYQAAYGKIYQQAPELTDPNSDVVRQWQDVLREFSNVFATNGMTVDISPDKITRFVQFACQNGYSLPQALMKAGITERKSHRLLFTSLYALRSVVAQSHPDIKITITTFPDSASYVNSAERIFTHYQERGPLNQCLEENIERYKDPEMPPPYLNPLQLSILKDYLDCMSLEEMAVKYQDAGLDRHGLIGGIRDLLHLLGGEVARTIPFRNEFRTIIKKSLLSPSNLLDDLLLLTGQQQPSPFPAEDVISQTVVEASAAGRKMVESENVSEAVRLRVDGVRVEKIAQMIGCGKNTLYTILEGVERRAIAWYFPKLTEPYNALFSVGESANSYLVSNVAMFDLNPLPSFTPDETIGWLITRERAHGKLAKDIMTQRGLAEVIVSSYSYLAVLASLKNALQEESPRERKVLKRVGTPYPLEIDKRSRRLVINDQDMTLSEREYILLTYLLENNGVASYEQIYRYLYPDKEYIMAYWQSSDIITIANNLGQKLGADIREENFFYISSREQIIRLNPLKFGFDSKGKINVYYQYSPFGNIVDMALDNDGILHIDYDDSHDRMVKLTPHEARVLSILIAEKDWLSGEETEQLVYPDCLPGTKMSLVRDALDGIRRKIAAPFPHPGYILSDNSSNLHLITSEDLSGPSYVFKTINGLYTFNPVIFALQDCQTNKLIGRLGRRETRALTSIIDGTQPASPKDKGFLRNWLIENGVLPHNIPLTGWDGALILLDDASRAEADTHQDQDLWRQNILVTALDENRYRVIVQTEREELEEVEVESGIIDMLKLDPLDPNNFCSRKNGLLPPGVTYPPLSQEETTVLLIRAKAGDLGAQKRIIQSSKLFISIFAQRVRGFAGIKGYLDDLVAQGFGGVRSAIKSAVLAKPDEFAKNIYLDAMTYITQWVKNNEQINIPQVNLNFAQDVYEIREKLAQEGTAPAPQIIARQILIVSLKLYSYAGRSPTEILDPNPKVTPPSIRKSYIEILDKVRLALLMEEKIRTALREKRALAS